MCIFSQKSKLEMLRDIARKREENLSAYACKSDAGKGFFDNESFYQYEKREIRPRFFHDTDRIIHSKCYTRYIDKTQVFYLVENDSITHRVLHVQLVSKIARTIGRYLRLNEDLIEAISLGHDVGHSPFGHNGESIISKFCEKNNCGCFQHNVQSFRLFHEIEKQGKGLNLSVQVLDGIICHNGEVLSNSYKANSKKTADDLLQQYNEGLLDKKVSSKMVPMTLEGCVMKISDAIAYIGRDIEDAIILNLIERNDIPIYIREVLGDDNRSIINNLVYDVIENSYDKDCLMMSKNVYDAFNALKEWNYEHIYNNSKKKTQDDVIEKMFNSVLDRCYEDMIHKKGVIYNWFNNNTDKYKMTTKTARVVADFVSGMTDDYLMKTYEKIIMPKPFGSTFKKSSESDDDAK